MPELESERRALQLFEAMLEMDVTERLAWLDRQTRDDPELKRRVTQLADADRTMSLRTGGAVSDLDEAEPPDRIGAYCITGLIGAGGMGSVFAARRDRGDFDHEVAIKLIKPGILSKKLVERFARERQLLAQFNHPHIARLFDGGETADGQPYLVMERIDGAPLLEWLENAQPTASQRIDLFLHICDAVGYAHRNLIVHRDLTPANVLVDRDGQAKLIDFGIASPAEEEATIEGEDALRRLTLTPGFAAPERMHGRASTTLADIYSAGRLLAWMIEKPRGEELNAIVAKASARDPAERYLTMDALARDVKAYREGHPVSALQAGRLYRWRKYLLRHQLQTALAGALIVAVLGGLLATGWNWRQAEIARADAENRFEQVRQLARFMLFDLYDDLEPVAGNTAALARIADRSRRYLEELDSAASRPDLQLDVGRGYLRLAEVAGSPVGANLGDRLSAGRMLEQALEVLGGLHQADPSNPEHLRALADAHYAHSVFLFISEDDNSGAIEAADRSAALYGELTRSGQATLEDRRNWFAARIQAAKPFVWIDRGEEGVRRLRAVIEEVDAFAARRPADLEAAMVRASAHSSLANAISFTLDPEGPEYLESVTQIDRAIEIYDEVRRNPAYRDNADTNLIVALFNKGLIMPDAGNLPDALAALERAEAIAAEREARDPDDTDMARRREAVHSQMIFVLLDMGDHARAEALARELSATRVARAQRFPDNPGHNRDAANGLIAYAETLEAASKHQQACARYRAARRAWDTVAMRWSTSAIDREGKIAPLDAALVRCETRRA